MTALHGSVYQCGTRHRLGPDACAQTPIDRATVDGAILGELESRWVDLDSLRATIEAKIAADILLARTALADAEREAKLAGEAYERVRRDYQRGAIEADDWAEQRPQLQEELDGAEAALGRVRAREAETLKIADINLDAELLRRLGHLHDEIIGARANPEGLEEQRRIVRRLFEAIVYRPGTVVPTLTAEYAAAAIPIVASGKWGAAGSTFDGGFLELVPSRETLENLARIPVTEPFGAGR
jgi:hypothetical protein